MFTRIFLAIGRALLKGTDMKCFLYILSAFGLVLGYTACEKQNWEETRVLHLKHSEEGKGHDQDGDKGHKEAGNEPDHDSDGGNNED